MTRRNLLGGFLSLAKAWPLCLASAMIAYFTVVGMLLLLSPDIAEFIVNGARAYHWKHRRHLLSIEDLLSLKIILFQKLDCSLKSVFFGIDLENILRNQVFPISSIASLGSLGFSTLFGLVMMAKNYIKN